VFGVSSDEYLNYAEANRKEWEVRGQEVVQKMVQDADAMLSEQGDSKELITMDSTQGQSTGGRSLYSI